mgnify:CR=1 FL=1
MATVNKRHEQQQQQQATVGSSCCRQIFPREDLVGEASTRRSATNDLRRSSIPVLSWDSCLFLLASALVLKSGREVLPNPMQIFSATSNGASDATADSRTSNILCYLFLLSFLLNRARIFDGNYYWHRLLMEKLFRQKSEEEGQSSSVARYHEQTSTGTLPRQSKQTMCRSTSSQMISKLSMRNFSINNCRKLRGSAATHVISSQELFASSEEIAELNLKDITTSIFQYAIKINRGSFRRSEFLSSLSTNAQRVIYSIDEAVARSRGPNIGLNTSEGLRKSGDMDALYFAAAVRVYTEWRTACLVPEGYKRYRLGVSMARKDILQNLEKFENAVHGWIEATQPLPEEDDALLSEDSCLVAPTLRQLLTQEIEAGVHTQLPYLTEQSGANALLWIKRQLELVNTTFIKSMQVPVAFPSTRAASEAAYKEVYGPYHSWGTAKIFHYSFQGSPNFDVILKLLKENLHDVAVDTAAALSSTQVADSSKAVDLVNVRSVPTETRNGAKDLVVENVLSDLIENIGKEWGRFVNLLSKFNCHDISLNKKGSNVAGPLVSLPEDHQVTGSQAAREFLVPKRTESDISSATNDVNSSVACEEYESKSAIDIYGELAIHTEQMTNVLDEVSKLIVELNMNDPTRV